VKNFFRVHCRFEWMMFPFLLFFSLLRSGVKRQQGTRHSRWTYSTVGHRSHDSCFHVGLFLMEAVVITFVAHCARLYRCVVNPLNVMEGRTTVEHRWKIQPLKQIVIRFPLCILLRIPCKELSPLFFCRGSFRTGTYLFIATPYFLAGLEPFFNPFLIYRRRLLQLKIANLEKKNGRVLSENCLSVRKILDFSK